MTVTTANNTVIHSIYLFFCVLQNTINNDLKKKHAVHQIRKNARDEGREVGLHGQNHPIQRPNKALHEGQSDNRQRRHLPPKEAIQGNQGPQEGHRIQEGQAQELDTRRQTGTEKCPRGTQEYATGVPGIARSTRG